jgi:hypothetical protein
MIEGITEKSVFSVHTLRLSGLIKRKMQKAKEKSPFRGECKGASPLAAFDPLFNASITSKPKWPTVDAIKRKMQRGKEKSPLQTLLRAQRLFQRNAFLGGMQGGVPSCISFDP